MFFLYTIGLAIAFVLSLPLFLYQMLLRGKYREGLSQRLGSFPTGFSRKFQGAKTIWVHAVSVGEVLAALPLLQGLRKAYPNSPLVLTTTTNTGQEVARINAGDLATVCFFPLDFPFAVRKAFDALQPRLLILMETEIWPNAIREAHRRKVPVMLLNGRLSPKSFKRYWAIRRLLRRVLDMVAAFGMQTQEDLQRMTALGAAKLRVRLTGNLKFEKAVHGAVEAEQKRREYSQLFGFPAYSRVVVAGSTHAGEEALMLEMLKGLRDRHIPARLVLAPRHPERRTEVAQLLKTGGWRWVARSGLDQGAIGGNGNGVDVILLDTVGELAAIYALADVAVVGGSFVPHGGQNPLEPASLGKPVVFGPSMHNFREITAFLLKHKAAVQATHESALTDEVAALLLDANAAGEMGRRARELLHHHQGATGRCLELVGTVLPTHLPTGASV